MKRGVFKVVEHGAGLEARKATDIALKRRNREVTAVDLGVSKNKKYLKELGLTHKPENLSVVSLTRSLDYLRKQKPNSIHCQYALFSVSAMPSHEVFDFLKEVHRTLVPGGRFILVDGSMDGVPFSRLLMKLGFRTSFKYVGLDALDKLDTPSSKFFAQMYRVEIANSRKKQGDIADDLSLRQTRVIAPERESFIRNTFYSKERNKDTKVVAFVEERMRRGKKASIEVNQNALIVATKPR